MDRGGTITWYLNANDVSFMATLAKARAEAKLAGSDIDKSLSNGATSARNAVKGLDSDSTRLSTSLRNVRKDTVNLGNDSDRLRSALGNLALSQRGLNQSLGGSALRGFGLQLTDTEQRARRTGSVMGAFRGSLDDFNRTLGRAATNFRNMQIALRGFELTAMIIAATTAAGAVLSLASAVAALGGLLYTIPAGVGVAAAAMATLGIGTAGVADAFKEVIKPVKGATAAQNLARRQSDITASAMKRDAQLVRQLNDLQEQYGETLQELAEERMRKLNEQIVRGTEAWQEIADAAKTYLDISAGLADLQLGVAQAQGALNAAIVNYGAQSQQAIEASRNLFAAQGRLAQSNADLDSNYNTIKDTIKDLSTNLESLRKANRNQISATQANLKALRLDKKARNESTNEIDAMIEVLDQLASIKDTNLTTNVNTAAAQTQLDDLKRAYPEIAVAAQEAATDTEQSLTKSLGNIAESMEDVRRERAELATELQQSLADAAEQSAQGTQGKDPFAGLSANAAAFVRALKDVYDAFQPIKNEIQDRLFAGLDTEIRNVAEVSFPTLRKGLGLIADSMNGVAKEASRVIQSDFFQGAAARSMETTAKAVDILKGAVEPLAKTFTNLMDIGNPYVLMLAEWVKKQTELAAAFTSSEKGQKRITKAIDLGLTALQELFGLFKEVGGLLIDVFGIGAEEGFSMIGTLTEMVRAMRDFVATEEGAAQIKALFEAADTILRAFGGNAGIMLQALLEIVEAFNNLDGPAKDFIANMIAWGVVLTPILTYVSSIWSTGKLMFAVFREGVQLAGGLAQFGQGLAGVMTTAEGTKGKINDIGLAIHDAFSNSVSKVKEWGTNVATVVGDGAKKFADFAKESASKAATVAADGAKAAAGWVTGAAKAAGAWVAQFVTMIARGVIAVATMVAQAAVAAGAWIAGAVATAAAWVIANAAMLGIWGLIILAVIGAVALIVQNWDSIKQFFIDVFNGIKDAVATAINWVKENWPLLLAILTGPIGLAVLAIVKNWDEIKAAFSAAWEFIKGIWSGVGEFFQGVWNWIRDKFNGIKDSIINAFWTALEWIKGLPRRILDGLGNIGSMLWDSGWSLIMGLWHGIENAFSKVKNWVGDKLRGLRNLFPFSPAKEGPFSGAGYTENSGEALMRDFGMGIVHMGSTVLNQTEGIVGQVANAFTGLAADVGTMQTQFGLSANSTMAADIGGMAPAVMDAREGTAELGGGTPVVINQTNEVHTDVDMEQVNRNLAWEMNKL